MKAKTKVILGSAMTAAMCASLIAGSTFALFTSEAKTNIAITAGKVKVTAEVTDLKYASDITDTYAEDAWKTAEESTSAEGETLWSGAFENTGTVVYNATKNTLDLTSFTPGDAVKFTFTVKNESTVKTKYQVRLVETSGNGLLEFLKVTADEAPLSGSPMVITDWADLNAITGDAAEQVDTVEMMIALPSAVTSEQAGDKKTTLALTVVAAQGNAATCAETGGMHEYGKDDVCFWCGQKNPFTAHHTEGSSTYTITGVDEGVTELAIPGEINGKSVQIGANAFNGNGELTSVTLGEGITSVGASAFDGCSNLESVELPETLTAIGNNAFANCGQLTSVNFPENLTSIGSQAFYSSPITGDIELPEGLETIGWEAFTDTKLTSVTIPDSVTSIGLRAFMAKNDREPTLTSITFGAGLTTIPEKCCTDQKQLKEVVIKSATTIGESAFSGVGSLERVELPENLETIGSGAFQASGIKEISFPESLKKIEQRGIGSLSKITIPSVEWWFALDQVDAKNTSTDVRNYMFGGRKIKDKTASVSKYDSEEAQIYVGDQLLTDLVIPESVTEIKACAFLGYTSLQSVTLHSGVTSIGSQAFMNCYNLRVVRDNAASIEVVKGETGNGYIGAYALQVFEGTEGTITTDTETVSGFEFYTEGETNYLLGATDKNMETLTLPTDYKGKGYTIVDYAFCGYNNATSIVFPTGGQIDAMGVGAFRDCEQVTSIKFESNCGVMAIGKYAFYSCAMVRGTRGPTSDDEILTVEFAVDCGVTEIGEYAFAYNDALTSFKVPASVMKIGKYAFRSDSYLKSIEFAETDGWKLQKSTPTEVAASTMANKAQMAKNLYNDLNWYLYDLVREG